MGCWLKNKCIYPCSLEVVGILWEKSDGQFLISSHKSVHSIVSQEKNPHQFNLGNLFYSSSHVEFEIGLKMHGNEGLWL